jgi:hypothetical protein
MCDVSILRTLSVVGALITSIEIRSVEVGS